MYCNAHAAGIPVVRPEDIETTARGAALAAGIGAGLWPAEAVFQEVSPRAPINKQKW